VIAAVVFVVVVLLALEGLVFVVTEVWRARSETAYWDARASRPELYDWAREFDL
jgi:hypothetical protein